MRPAFAPVILLTALAGCTNPVLVGGEGVRVPDDVCEHTWVIGASVLSQEATQDGVRTVFELGNDSTSRNLRDVRFTLRWGPDDQSMERMNGTLEQLLARRGPWWLEDSQPLGILGSGDRLTLESPHAKPGKVWALIDLGDAQGMFIGGSARCA